MAFFQPYWALALAISYLIYRYILYPTFISPLTELPSAHPTSSFSSLWISHQRRHFHESRTILTAHQRHGPIVRLAPNEVSVCSLEALHRIYGSKADFQRTEWFEMFRNYDGTPNMVTLYDTAEHTARRRMVSNVFSKSYLTGSGDFQRLAAIISFERFLPVLSEAAEKGTSLDVYGLACAVGTEFMSAYQVGSANGVDLVRKGKEKEREVFLDNGKRKLMEIGDWKPAAKALEELCLETMRNAERFLSGAKTNGDSTYPVVFAPLKAGITTNDRLKDEKNTTRLVASELLDNLEAARVGIGIALTYAMWQLSQRPALQSALRSELQNLEKAFCISPSAENQNSFSTADLRQLDKLPLLDAVVTETLRLHAPAPGPSRRRVPAGGAVIEGHFIPAGTDIHSSSICLHRQPDVFPEPDKWTPERWLETQEYVAEGDVEKGSELRRWFWAFGSGGRKCIGNNFALIGESCFLSCFFFPARETNAVVAAVLKLLVASIYANFTTEIVDDEGIEQLDWVLASPAGDKLILSFKRVAVQ
jgi:cytochrome P450